MNKKIFFLSHPYSPQDGSHLYSQVGRDQVQENVNNSIEITNELLDKGFNIFNPLTHSHSLDEFYQRASEFWYDLDLLFLERFDGIIMAPGWESSKGCKKEFQFVITNIIRTNFVFEILFYETIMREET